MKRVLLASSGVWPITRFLASTLCKEYNTFEETHHFPQSKTHTYFREETTMQIGIGHPGTIPGVAGQLILDWAKRADAGPFSSLGSLDRLVYPNYEPLI